MPSWFILGLFGLILAVTVWQTQSNSPRRPADSAKSPPASSHSTGQSSTRPSDEPITAPIADERDDPPETVLPSEDGKPAGRDKSSTAGSPATLIEYQTIRDQNGKVLYRGSIDLQPTLDRIARGERNVHRNDGSTFQNRERRLPAKAAGYYREYVHPTPGDRGPGPQRVIMGHDGDIWYTPDHYQTFQKIR